MRCFAEKSVLAKQKKSSSGSRVFSSQATAANHCFKPHAAPGCGTAPACMNTSSDSIRNHGGSTQVLSSPWQRHTVCFLLRGSHGLTLSRRIPICSVQSLLPHGTSLGVSLDGTDTWGATETGTVLTGDGTR